MKPQKSLSLEGMIRAQNVDLVPNLGKSGDNAGAEGLIRSEKLVGNYDSSDQVLETQESLLLPSEPPAVKNWFSSYEYESFVLETNDNFGFSENQESEGEKEEFKTGNIMETVEDSRGFTRSVKNDRMMGEKTPSSMLIKCNQSGVDNACEHQLLSQAVDSPDSPLPLSVPPGIENWFSSYKYESPNLDTSEDPIFADRKESIVVEEHSTGKVTKEGQKIASMGNNKYESPFVNQRSIVQGGNLSAPNELSSKSTCNQTLEVQKPEACNNGSSSNVKNSTINANYVDNAAQMSPTKPYRTKDSATEANAQKDQLAANGNSWIRTRSYGIEDHEKAFVSTRRSKPKNENDENSLSCYKKKQGTVGVVKDERKTLADTTNIGRSEITGKWKCPRKSKPELGPPLKQLRLGQWFHRV